MIDCTKLAVDVTEERLPVNLGFFSLHPGTCCRPRAVSLLEHFHRSNLPAHVFYFILCLSEKKLTVSLAEGLTM